MTYIRMWWVSFGELLWLCVILLHGKQNRVSLSWS